MAVFVGSMAVILIMAVAVLLAVFVMHEITSSPQVRIRMRRWALASGAWAYSIRRQTAYRARLVVRWANRWLGPPASHVQPMLNTVAERADKLAERGAMAVAERVRPLIASLKTGIGHGRPLTPPHAGRRDIADRRRTAR